MSTGAHIRQARKAAGLTQQELADKLNVSASMIGQYENNLRNPKLETLVRIAQAIGVPLSEIWKRETDVTIDSEEYTEVDDATNTITINMGKYSESFHKKAMNLAFDKLNAEGQAVAMSRVEELTEIPKYKK